MGTKTPQIEQGQFIKIDVLLDTQKEEINAIEGELIYPANLLSPEKIVDGGSVINLWVENPSDYLTKDRNSGTINFSGITPGGYYGKKGFVISAVFRAIGQGTGLVEIKNVRALLNDGLGTETESSLLPVNFEVLPPVSGQQPPNAWFMPDDDLPEPFTPEIAVNPEIFDGRPFLVFATQDKKSGISHYEVGIGNGDFNVAESPYPLSESDLFEKITVKAVDNAGNERPAVIPPQKKESRPFNKALIFSIIIAVFILVLVAKLTVRRKTAVEK